MSEIMPCPFCGVSDAEVDVSPLAAYWVGVVNCIECQAAGPFSIELDEKKAKQVAIDLWNSRRIKIVGDGA